MFREWGFLITEIGLLLVLAVLLGVLVGWIIWGRRQPAVADTSGMDGLRSELAQCRAERAELDAQLAEAHAARTASLVTGEMADLAAQDGVDATAIVAEPIEDSSGTKPETLSAPRGGAADDLKQIKGIGPKLEKMCHDLGFYHFDQIAAWTPQEEAWVDANLEGFKGRARRDNWIAQAKVLAAGGETDFSKRVGDGGVY